MIQGKNILEKELVKTLSYTTSNQPRNVYSNVVINGRNYLKGGVLQSVTVVCNVYKIYNSESKTSEYWAYFGMSKQHPCDTRINKELGYEIANENANINPFCILKVNKRFGENTFRDMIRPYVDDMDLEYIKTKEEIELNPFNDIKKYNR